MALPMEYANPQYAQQQAIQGRNNSGFDLFKKHALGLGGSILQGAQGALSVNNAIYPQGQNQQQPQVQGPLNKPQTGIPLAQDAQNQMNGMQQLAQMLQDATAHKVGMMSQGIQGPTNPQRWQQQATNAVNQTNSGAPTPQWGGNQQGASQGFDFSRLLGAGSSMQNPLGVLDNLGGAQDDQAAIADRDKSWWRKGLNLGGDLAQGGASLAGAFKVPGVSAALGGGLGALGYGLKQF